MPGTSAGALKRWAKATEEEREAHGMKTATHWEGRPQSERDAIQKKVSDGVKAAYRRNPEKWSKK